MSGERRVCKQGLSSTIVNFHQILKILKIIDIIGIRMVTRSTWVCSRWQRVGAVAEVALSPFFSLAPCTGDHFDNIMVVFIIMVIMILGHK